MSVTDLNTENTPGVSNIDLSINSRQNVNEVVVPSDPNEENKELEISSNSELVSTLDAVLKDEGQEVPSSKENKEGLFESSPPLVVQVKSENEDLNTGTKVSFNGDDDEPIIKVIVTDESNSNTQDDNTTDEPGSILREDTAKEEAVDHKKNEKEEKTPSEVEQEKTPKLIPEEIDDWKQEKEKCLNANIEERQRKTKKCTELSSIETWPEYYNKYLNIGTEKAEPEFPVISSKISLWKGDITSLLIDAIVNAANETLMGGGGVDGAIHAAAGPLLKKECATLNGCPIGESVITGGYDLPARYVIHTVGPRGENPAELKNSYLTSLDLLLNENQRTIAFPCISTGIFGYPNENAAEVVLETIREWLRENHEKVDRVIFCLFLEKDICVYQKKMQQYFPMLGGRTDEPSSNPTVREDDNNATEQQEGETAALISSKEKKRKWKNMICPCCFAKKTS